MLQIILFIEIQCTCDMFIQGDRKIRKGTLDGRLIEKACLGSNDLFYVPWLRSSTVETILTKFGQTDGPLVIEATNDYLDNLEYTKANNLADFINTYPYFAGITGGVYQQVEYIQTTGSQYINSGYYIHNNDTIITDCRLDANSACVPWGTTDYSIFLVGSSGENYWRGKAHTSGQAHRSYVYNKFTKITENKVGIYYGTTQRVWFGNSTSADETDNKYFWIGKNNSPKGEGSGYNTSSMSFKNYRINNQNGEAQVFYIPCYRKSDNVIGMIDIARNRFDTNSGSGTFSKGNNIDPTIY